MNHYYMSSVIKYELYYDEIIKEEKALNEEKQEFNEKKQV